MNKAQLIHAYITAPITRELLDKTKASGAKVRIVGSSGSSLSIFLNCCRLSDHKIHLYIATNKDEAAYFYNDMESLNNDNNLILFYPEAHKEPYEKDTLKNANVSIRTEVLDKIVRYQTDMIIVTYPEALSEKIISTESLESNTIIIEKGGSYSIDFINEMLIEDDFEKVDFVYEPGQMAVRGGIVDIFSYSKDKPYRLEFFGDKVDSIRQFNPVNQLSDKEIDKAQIISNISKTNESEKLISFLSYLPYNAVVWFADIQRGIQTIKDTLKKAEERYKVIDNNYTYRKPQELYVSSEETISLLTPLRTIEIGTKYFKDASVIQLKEKPQPAFNKNFDLLASDLARKAKKGYVNLLCAANSKQVERLLNIFNDKEKSVQFTPILLRLHEGFINDDLKIACYTDHQIFERHHRFFLKEGFSENNQAFTLKELNNLKKGDLVTHIDHGIGRYSGFEKITINGKQQEAIRLLYKNNDVLYVSIHSLHRIAKYSGKEGASPKINKLGTNAWKALKQKTSRKVKELAFDLIKLYAKRKSAKGFAFTPDTYLQNELEASFIYEDTPDQILATSAVKKDLEDNCPMDRLICGDVGFGKTEIAIRAAFKVVADSKQVAFLAPTTILTLQHFHTLSERFKDMPCTVDYINRFKSTKQQKETLKKLIEGKIDILIGTHKLVSKDVKFKDLGLLIIDEEQKFGVGVKEKLKTLKSNVDTLTMTATPIPRTLQFSMMGARDLSLINTPPPNRQPVLTSIISFTEESISEAIAYELSRNGQVFFVNNRIDNIMEVAGMIQRLIPDAKVGVGHGQMEGKKLEKLMIDFIEGDYDVLVATSIIESGIDIPNANTIIVNNAHNFGLSDLHQLRGRVGRSNKKAFCYLISPPTHAITDEARRRLKAMEQFSDLGSGFNIAMLDLNIRGAGNMLGAEQSGFITDIGFEMYHKILEEAIQELKEEEFKDVFQNEPKAFVHDCTIETDLEILIPDTYVSDIDERLALYKEVDGITDEDALLKFLERMIDRFGKVPTQVNDLLLTKRIRWLAKDLGFEKLVLKSNKLIGYFIKDSNSPYFQTATFSKILAYLAHFPKDCSMQEKNDKLSLVVSNIYNVKAAHEFLQQLLSKPELQS